MEGVRLTKDEIGLDRRRRRDAVGILLSEDQIGLHIAGGRETTVDQDPVVPRVGHHEHVVVHENPGWQEHPGACAAPAVRRAL